jgi:hypothetical protein
MAAGLADRMGRSGFPAMSEAEGLALFDAALGMAGPVLVPTGLDVRALGSRAGGVPAVLRGLVRPARRVAASEAGSGSGLKGRLAALSPAERVGVTVEVVRSHAAAVLGFGSAAAVEPGRAFRDMGFDSLTAVELRNRLAGVCGLRLPATLVFDYPTPTALADHLVAELLPAPPSPAVQMLADLERMEAAFAGLHRTERTRLRARMDALLAKWSDAATGDVEGDDRDIETATEDTIFDLIDSELETSG